VTDDEIAALDERGWFLRDGLVGAALAAAAHAEAERIAPSLCEAGVSRGPSARRDPATRGDAIAWLAPPLLDEHTPALAALAACLRALGPAANRAAFLGLGRAELQLARYPGDGARYARHRDAFPGGPNRRLTAICYLNPGWRPADGGLLRLHAAGGPVDVPPLLDRLVVFLAARVEHEVLPCFAPRLAATAWFYGAEAIPP
jgi:SM-20-related protein